MPTRRQLIQKITLNANVSSVTFSNIPQNYTDLKIVTSMRESINGAAGSYRLEFNGSSSNLSYRLIYGNGSSVASETLSDRITFYGTGNAANSNTYDSSEIYIPNYTSSNSKSLSIKWSGESNSNTGVYLGWTAGLWTNSSAINSITIKGRFDNSTTIMAGSTIYLYGITHVPIIRGGEVSVPGDGFKYHTFRSTASLQVIEGGNVQYLAVAGGGGGGGCASGSNGAGGGGAGGLLTSTNLSITPQTYTVTVGGGGNGGIGGAKGTNGSNSTISTITSVGGGGGGSSYIGGDTKNGNSGGSGGGGSAYSGNGAGGTGTSGQGNNGGSGLDTSNYGGGGGGGAGSSGVNAIFSAAGNGGSGLTVFGRSLAGGGGGGTYGASGSKGAGGIGGGGSANITTGDSGGTNTGGGGGGASNPSGAAANGGNGGSGIVIIRYPYDGN